MAMMDGKLRRGHFARRAIHERKATKAADHEFGASPSLPPPPSTQPTLQGTIDTVSPASVYHEKWLQVKNANTAGLLNQGINHLGDAVGPGRVLVRVAASSGGGTSVGPGPRWRPQDPRIGCADRSSTRTRSSVGFERRGSAQMARRNVNRGPASGARARGGQQRRGDRRRPWTSLAALGPDAARSETQTGSSKGFVSWAAASMALLDGQSA